MNRRPLIRVAPANERRVDGILFASKAESKRYRELCLLRQAGMVRWFIRQPKFDLPGGTTYTADFLIVQEDGSVTVEDVKGYATAAFKRSKKQVEALYPIEVQVVTVR